MTVHPSRFALYSLALVLLGAAAFWKFGMPAPPRDLTCSPLTFDPGVVTRPAISPDGRLLSYASDREGGTNLDLYLQPLRGGASTRLTWSDGDESAPSFSSDGSALAYHSTQDGGGIYLIPSLGGTPRLLMPAGRDPRFSPRRNEVAYWTGLRDAGEEGKARSFVVPIAGGEPREIRADFSDVQRPVWSPDGRWLIVWAVEPSEGRPGGRADFWVTGFDRDKAESTGLAGPVFRAGGTLAAIDDMSWTDHGLVFSMRTGWVRSVYRCPMTPNGKAAGELVRLSGGTASAEFPAMSRDGQLVFASSTQRYDVWGLPLDANRGKALGPPYRITNSTAPTEYPSISADGRKVFYASPRNGTSQVWMKDLVKGEESVIAPGPNASIPAWIRGGRGIAFTQKSAGRSDEYLLDLGTSLSRKVFEGGFFWDLNQASTVAVARQADSNPNDILAVDLATGKPSVILRAPRGVSLTQAHYSPNDEWIVFVADRGPGNSQIYVARPNGWNAIPQVEWMAVTDGRHKVDKPRFSPDGKLIYFTQDRDARRSIRAVPFNPRLGQPAGDDFPVFDSDQPHLSLFGVAARSLTIGIAGDKLVMLMADNASNLWTSVLPTDPRP